MPVPKTGSSRTRKEEMMARFQQWGSLRAPAPPVREAARPEYPSKVEGRTRRVSASRRGASLAVLAAVAVAAAVGTRAVSADGSAASPNPAGPSAASGSPAATTVQLAPTTLGFGYGEPPRHQ